MSARISLIAIVVPDYDAGIAFYAEVLGWDVVADEDQGGGKRWVVVAPPGGGTSILLARAVGAEQSNAIGNQTGGRVGFFLETDDFARDHAAMRAAGVHLEEEPRAEAYGTVVVWQDPFGNRWDLIEPVDS